MRYWLYSLFTILCIGCVLSISLSGISQETSSQPATIAHAILQQEAQSLGYAVACPLLDAVLNATQRTITVPVTPSHQEVMAIFQQIAAILQHQSVQVGDALLLRDTCRPHVAGKQTIHYGDCDTLSFLYLAIADVLQLPLRLVALPDHTFVRWQFEDGAYLNWETTANAVWTDAQYAAWYNATHVDPLAPERDLRSLTPEEIWAIVWYNIGNALTVQGRYQEAMVHYTHTINLLPTYLNAYYQRGKARYERGYYDQAITDFTQVVTAAPRDANAFLNRGSAWKALADYDAALADFTRVLSLQPANADALYNRGMAWSLRGDDPLALADFDAALALNPRDAEALVWRGYVRNRQGEYARANADFTQAVQIDPWSAEANNALAWWLATCPDARYRNGQQAISYAQRALALQPALRMVYLDTLAAAYAEAGQFDRAVATQENAISLMEAAGDAEAVADYTQRLELYTTYQPYRESGTK